jgi:4-amino-4-deoxy-L-arabinose transferase-like glycosyltransferase
MSTPRATTVILLTLCLLAFALGAYRLGAQSLWFDEGESVWVPAQGLTSIAPIMSIRGLPPLYFYIIWAAVPLIGPSEFTLRFVSLAFGLLLVPLTFAFARRLYNIRVGLWTASLAAVSPFLVYYDQEARMYTLLAVLAILSMLAFVRILNQWNEQGRLTRRWSLVYVLATTAGLYTHHYTLFVIIAQVLFLLLCWRRYRPLFARGLALLAGVGLFYAPWVAPAWAIAATRMGGGEAYAFTPLTPWDLARQTLMAFSLGLTAADALPAALVAAVFCLLAVAGLWPVRFNGSRPAESNLLLALWLGVAFAGAYMVNLRSPWVHPRYLILVAPAFAILAGRGLATLAGRRWGRFVAVAAALVVALGCAASLWNLYYNPAYSKGRYRDLVAVMRELVRSDDAVVTNIPWQESLLWYYDVLPADGPELLYLPQEYVRRDQAEHARRLGDLTSRHRRVWLVLYGLADGHPDSLVERWLDAHTYQAFNLWFQDSRLLLYSLPASGQYVSDEVPQGPISADFGGVIRLTGVITAPLAVPAGDVLHVDLGWQALQAPRADYVVALHLLDNTGYLVGQRDAGPLVPTSQWAAGQTVADHHGVLVPVGTPSGTYRLTLSLYARDDGARLGEPVPVGTIRVARPATFPAPADVLVSHRTGAMWGGVQLIGYDVDREAFRAGETARLTMLWHTQSPPGRDLNVTLQLRGAQRGGVVAQRDAPLAPGYPASQWAAGEVVRARHDLPIGGRAAPGRYDLVAFVEGREAVLGTLEVLSRPINAAVPPIQHPLRAHFGQSIELLGYNTQSANAQSTTYQLIWRCTGPVETSYAVFVHLLDAQEGRVAQHDSPVPGGGVPTAGWQPGEVVADEHTITWPTSVAPGIYRLIAGMYDPITEARLPVLDDAGQPIGDHVLLTTVEVAR